MQLNLTFRSFRIIPNVSFTLPEIQILVYLAPSFPLETDKKFIDEYYNLIKTLEEAIFTAQNSREKETFKDIATKIFLEASSKDNRNYIIQVISFIFKNGENETAFIYRREDLNINKVPTNFDVQPSSPTDKQ